jgi:7-cyano-7-deazaguanine synthase in queuosine biosynthesis
MIEKTDKKVLLFSPGLDSVCFSHLLKPDMLLHIRMGSKYEDREIEAIEKMVAKKHIDQDKLIILSNTLNLSAYERPDDLIIPNRNAHLILLASNYGEEIILNTVNGDQRLKDKDRDFYFCMEQLLNHMWQAQRWTKERKFKIGSPFANLTKTQLVAKYLDDGGNPQVLLDSYSCHVGTKRHCGVCKPCFRKHVALANNGIDVNGYFENQFWKTDLFKTIWYEIQAKQYYEEQGLDVIRFIENNSIQVD